MSPPGFIPPIAEYTHELGRCSITGGYVYRGRLGTLPLGAYVYGDYCSGEIFTLLNGSQTLLAKTNLNIASFGEDEAGEIYVVGLGGTIHRIVNPSVSERLAVGLGRFDSNGGWLGTYAGSGAAFALQEWNQVPWPAYNASNGETHPAVGDVDFDSRAEILFGLGKFAGDGGWLYAVDDATSGYGSLGWFQIDWSAFSQDGGETFPAIGRLR